jgi:hypothetical protein
LVSIHIQVDFLMGMSPKVVSGNITGNYHHWHSIQGGIGDAGSGVGEAGTEMAQHNTWFPGHAGVTIGHVSGYLLVAGDDKPNLTFVKRINKGNISVPTEAKNDLNPQFFQIICQLV